MCVISCFKLLLQLKLAAITTVQNVLNLVSMEIGVFGDNIAASARPVQAGMHERFVYAGYPHYGFTHPMYVDDRLTRAAIEPRRYASNVIGLSNHNTPEFK